MWGSRKQSFRHALLRSVKSTQMRHLPFFFSTTTGFASHSRYLTSRIKPASRSMITLEFTTSVRSEPSFRRFCLTGLKVWSTLSSCEMTSVLIPVIFPTVEAKVPLFFLRKSINLLRKLSPRLTPTPTSWSRCSSLITTLSTRSSPTFLIGLRAASTCGCYLILSLCTVI